MSDKKINKSDAVQLVACIMRRQKEVKKLGLITWMDFDLIPKEDVDEYKQRIPEIYEKQFDEITEEYYQRLEELKNQIFEDNF